MTTFVVRPSVLLGLAGAEKRRRVRDELIYVLDAAAAL